MDRQKIDIVILATPNIAFYADETVRQWRAYAIRHGYEVTVYQTKIINDWHINWSKIEHARRHLAESSADWVVVADADTVVDQPDIGLDRLIAQAGDCQIIFSADTACWFGFEFPLDLFNALRARQWRLPNAGFFMLRNGPQSRQFMDEWMRLPRGELAELADRPPRDQLVLWRGLLPGWKGRMHVLRTDVLRVVSNLHWDTISRSGISVFIRHDKRLTRDRVA